MSAPTIRPMACHVYRIKAWTGLLLYVGCTNDVDRRLAEHRRNSPWFPLAHSVDSQWYDGEASALEAERQAIRTERPLFNKTLYRAITAYESGELAQRSESEAEVGWAIDHILGGIFGMFDDEEVDA